MPYAPRDTQSPAPRINSAHRNRDIVARAPPPPLFITNAIRRRPYRRRLTDVLATVLLLLLLVVMRMRMRMLGSVTEQSVAYYAGAARVQRR